MEVCNDVHEAPNPDRGGLGRKGLPCCGGGKVVESREPSCWSWGPASELGLNDGHVDPNIGGKVPEDIQVEKEFGRDVIGRASTCQGESGSREGGESIIVNICERGSKVVVSGGPAQSVCGAQ